MQTLLLGISFEINKRLPRDARFSYTTLIQTTSLEYKSKTISYFIFLLALHYILIRLDFELRMLIVVDCHNI